VVLVVADQMETLMEPVVVVQQDFHHMLAVLAVL
jgi:hypothetical protein